jgi:ribosomal protein S21
MRSQKTDSKTIKGCLEVTAAECRGNADTMVRRFSKKVKKSGILEEARERLHFVKETTRRTEAKRNRKRVIEKINRERAALYTTTDRRVSKRRK